MGKKKRNDFVDPEEPADDALSAESFDDPETDDLEQFDAEEDDVTAEDVELVNIKEEIEACLLKKANDLNAAGIMAEDAFEDDGNIVGVGLGSPELDFCGLDPGGLMLNVYVAERTTVEEVKRSLADSMGIRAAASDDMNINVIETGPIDANSHRFHMRPAPGGVSCGHVDITAGTLGCLARGAQGDRRRRVMILSNNHVLANSNAGRVGDSIIQPGKADGGKNPRDRIALLEKFVKIKFDGSPNHVDCATGWAWHRRVQPKLVYLSGGARRLFHISSQIKKARRGMIVGKSGRTTQLTTGRVTDTTATIRVNYQGRIAVFKDQIAVRGLRRDFSAGGDSGSVIWTWDRTRNPIGLLFAGGGGVTFANHIDNVLKSLDIKLYT